MSVVNVIGGGDQDWAVIELEAHAKCKNGTHIRSSGHLHRLMLVLMVAGMPYEQRYSWALRFDETGIVVQVWQTTARNVDERLKVL